MSFGVGSARQLLTTKSCIDRGRQLVSLGIIRDFSAWRVDARLDAKDSKSSPNSIRGFARDGRRQL